MELLGFCSSLKATKNMGEPCVIFHGFSQDLKHAISYFNRYCVKHWPFIKNPVVIMIDKFSTVVWFKRVMRK